MIKQFKQGEVPTVIDSIVVVGTLKCRALLHSLRDLKAAQMNMKQSNLATFALQIKTWRCP